MNFGDFRNRVMDSAIVQRVALSSLLQMDPETAHRTTINILRTGLMRSDTLPAPPELVTTLCNMTLANPVGIAAGFDKDGEVPAQLAGIGFGMVEIGTVTPLPQEGNPKPRVFRLTGAEGIINRMGFNSAGHEAVYRRIAGLQLGAAQLGVNIGANKTSPDFVADYVAGVKRFAGEAGYLTVNVSSPNTPGLRDLQGGEALARLLAAVLEARAQKPSTRTSPIFLKLAPDLDEKQMEEIARVVLASGVDGLIVSNTTLSRDQVAGQPLAAETGGLSGKPLFRLSTQRLAQMRQRVGKLPIIGVGGISSAETAIAKFEAGADAIQLYTGLVFGGPSLVAEIKRGLTEQVRKVGASNVGELTGRRVAEWASDKPAF